jgi:hypothetical protein
VSGVDAFDIKSRIGLGKTKMLTTLGYFIAGIFFLQFFKIFPFSG